MSKKNKPIGYTLGERKVGIGPNKGKVVIQATPSGRHCMSFECFCELVAKDTTLNYMEVQSVLNLASDTAREVVTNGDIVDFGRLGTLSPSFSRHCYTNCYASICVAVSVAEFDRLMTIRP